MNSTLLILLGMLDDIAMQLKIVMGRCIGIVGDDIAAGAKGMSGIPQEREIPMGIRLMKGSLINKALLIPFCLAMVAFVPALVNYLLLLGGIFLAYEGLHGLFEIDSDDVGLDEDARVKTGIALDVVLSIEILLIALGGMQGIPIIQQAVVLTAVGLIMAFGIYGAVIVLVRLDNISAWLSARQNLIFRKSGAVLLKGSFLLIRALGPVGSVAMILVGGGVLLHTVPALLEAHELALWFAHAIHDMVSLISGFPMGESILSIIIGVLVGGVILMTKISKEAFSG